MPATWESQNSDAVTGAADTQLSITKPTGLAAGDKLVFFGGCVDSRSFNTPAGWTSELNNTNGTYRVQIFTKTADASDAAAGSFAFDLTAGSNQANGSLHRVSSASANALTTGTGTGANDTSQTCPTITTPSANCLVFWCVFICGNSGPCTASKGTERTDISQASPAVMQAVYTNLEATAGSITGATITSTGFGAKRVVSFAVESAAAAGSNPKGPLSNPFMGPFGGAI